jgi:hypothetical protein
MPGMVITRNNIVGRVAHAYLSPGAVGSARGANDLRVEAQMHTHHGAVVKRPLV